MNRFQKYRAIVEQQEDKWTYIDDEGVERTRDPRLLYPDPQSIKNPTNQPNAVNPSLDQRALDIVDKARSMVPDIMKTPFAQAIDTALDSMKPPPSPPAPSGPHEVRPSSTAADRLAADPSLGVPNPTLNKFLSSRAVELATDYDARQTALGVGGMAPGVGAVPDAAAALDSVFHGDLKGLGFNLLAIIPGLGIGARGAQLGAKGLKSGREAFETGKEASKLGDIIAGKVKEVKGGKGDLGSSHAATTSELSTTLKGHKYDPPLPGLETAARQSDEALEAERRRERVQRAVDELDRADVDELDNIGRIFPGFKEVPVTRRTVGRTSKEIDLRPRASIDPKTAAAAGLGAAAATGTTLYLTRPTSSPAPAPAPARDTTGTPPTTDTTPQTPRRDETDIPWTQISDIIKRSEVGATRMASPRGFREGVMDINFGSTVAPMLYEQTAGGGVQSALRGTFSGTSGAAIKGLLMIAGLAGAAQLLQKGGSAAGQVASQLTSPDALLAGAVGLDRLKAAGSFDPKRLPKIAAETALRNRPQ